MIQHNYHIGDEVSFHKRWDDEILYGVVDGISLMVISVDYCIVDVSNVIEILKPGTIKGLSEQNET